MDDPLAQLFSSETESEIVSTTQESLVKLQKSFVIFHGAPFTGILIFL